MLNRFQSLVGEHQQKWLKIVTLAHWLLYTASHEIESIQVKPWQKYLPKNKIHYYKDDKYADTTQPQPLRQRHQYTPYYLTDPKSTSGTFFHF